MTQSFKAKHLSRQCELINASLWQQIFLNNKKGKMSIPPTLPPQHVFGELELGMVCLEIMNL